MKMVNAMTDVKPPNFFEVIIVAEIKAIMKACDRDADRDFLDEFGDYRKDIVYKQEVVSDKRFDELCQMVLDDLNDEDEEHEKDI